MTRLPDWERLLSEYISSVRNRPFEWGEHDCILFACAAANVITGRDAASAYRGTYSDKVGAAKALRELGEGTLLATVDSQFERKSVGRAGRGDLIWRNGAVGVCMGGTAFFVGEARLLDGEPFQEGLMPFERAQWQKAWAV